MKKNIFKLVALAGLAAFTFFSCDKAETKSDYDYTFQAEFAPNADSLQILSLVTPDNVIVEVTASMAAADTNSLDFGVIAYTEEMKAAGEFYMASSSEREGNMFMTVFSELKNGENYTFQAFAFNKDGISYSASKDSAFVLGEWIAFKKKATYTDDLISGLFGSEMVTYEVPCEIFSINGEKVGKYRLVNPYGKVYPYNEDGDYYTDKNYYMTIDATNPEEVTVAAGGLGIDWGYGEMGIYGTMAPGSLLDGVIAFPEKGIAIYDNDGAYFANTRVGFRVVLPSE